MARANTRGKLVHLMRSIGFARCLSKHQYLFKDTMGYKPASFEPSIVQGTSLLTPASNLTKTNSGSHCSTRTPSRNGLNSEAVQLHDESCPPYHVKRFCFDFGQCKLGNIGRENCRFEPVQQMHGQSEDAFMQF